MTLQYRIERRIANTEVWNVIDSARTREDAIAKCSIDDRPLYAGVRIIAETGREEIDAWAEPEIIHGR